MNEQSVFLFFIVLSGISIFYLDIWKAKKEVDYKKDERWQLIQNKANKVANSVNYILIILIFIGQAIVINSETEITITLNRLCTYGLCFIGLRSAIEIFALRYFDNQI